LFDKRLYLGVFRAGRHEGLGRRLMTVSKSKALAAAAFLAVTACSNPFGPQSERVIGQISSDYGSVIESPDTVSVATSFMVTVNSFGSSSCTEPDGVDLMSSRLLAIVTPYDIVQTNTMCTMDEAPQPHVVRLQFNRVGEAIILARGYGRDEQRRRVLVSVAKKVVVRP
jgi:hypothetical protein